MSEAADIAALPTRPVDNPELINPFPEPPAPAPVAPPTVAPVVVPTLAPPAPVSVKPADVQATGQAERQANQEVAKLEEEQAKIAGQQTKAKVAAEASSAGDVAKLREAQTKELADWSAKADQRDAQLWEAHVAARKALEGKRVEDYWSSKSTGQKVAAGIALAFGAFGAGLSAAGGVNTGNMAAKQLMDAIELDYQRQVKNIDLLAGAVERTRGDVTMGAQRRKDELARIDARHGAALRAVEASAVAKLKALGLNDAAIASNANLIAIRKKIADDDAKKARTIFTDTQEAIKTEIAQEKVAQEKAEAPLKREKLRGDIEEGKASTALKRATAAALGSKPPSEFESKEAAFAERMTKDYQDLRSVPPMSEQGRETIRKYAAVEAMLEANPKINVGATILGRGTLESQLSPNDRKAFQAGRRLAAAQLRGESGAAISTGEYVNWDRQYLPVSGESKDDISRKYEGIELLIKGHERAGARALGKDARPTVNATTGDVSIPIPAGFHE